MPGKGLTRFCRSDQRSGGENDASAFTERLVRQSAELTSGDALGCTAAWQSSASLMMFALRRIPPGELLECAAEIVRMKIAQVVRDLFYGDSIILQQLDCPFHTGTSVISSDRFVQM